MRPCLVWRGLRLLAALLPIPLSGLHEQRIHLLQALQWIETHATQEPLTEDRVIPYHEQGMRLPVEILV